MGKSEFDFPEIITAHSVLKTLCHQHIVFGNQRISSVFGGDSVKIFPAHCVLKEQFDSYDSVLKNSFAERPPHIIKPAHSVPVYDSSAGR